MRSNVWRRAETSPGSTKCKKGGELYMARLYCRIVGPVLLVVGVLGVVQFGIPGFLSINEPVEIGLHFLTGALATYAGFSRGYGRAAVLYARVFGIVYLILCIIASRSLDNRIGAVIVLEALRLLSEEDGIVPEVVAVASVQQEIGLHGARGGAYGLEPDAAIAVDVAHATDTPGVSKNERGDHALGSGPVIKRASNLSPIVSEGLSAAAEEAGIAYTLEADSHTTGTDADTIQSRRAGIATGVVSCPNRHMHSPNESVDLEDLENCARLISAYVKTLDADADFIR